MSTLPRPEEHARLDIFAAPADGDHAGHVLHAVVVHPEGLQAAVEGEVSAVHVVPCRLPDGAVHTAEVERLLWWVKSC